MNVMYRVGQVNRAKFHKNSKTKPKKSKIAFVWCKKERQHYISVGCRIGIKQCSLPPVTPLDLAKEKIRGAAASA